MRNKNRNACCKIQHIVLATLMLSRRVTNLAFARPCDCTEKLQPPHFSRVGTLWRCLGLWQAAAGTLAVHVGDRTLSIFGRQVRHLTASVSAWHNIAAPYRTTMLGKNKRGGGTGSCWCGVTTGRCFLLFSLVTVETHAPRSRKEHGLTTLTSVDAEGRQRSVWPPSWYTLHSSRGRSEDALACSGGEGVRRENLIL